MRTRERLSADLTALGFVVLPSAANFIFARHPLHALASALSPAGADFVKGSRFMKGGGTDDMPLYRKLGNASFVGSNIPVTVRGQACARLREIARHGVLLLHGSDVDPAEVRKIALAATHAQIVLRQLDTSEADAQLYCRLAGSIIYANASLREPVK